jgi:hypothetical protein
MKWWRATFDNSPNRNHRAKYPEECVRATRFWAFYIAYQLMC